MCNIIVANYKMNGDKKFYHKVQKEINNLKLQDTKIILCPPFVYLPFLKINNKNVELGAQDVANRIDNKSTGQISPKMLNEFNVKYCLVGHFEKRILGESLSDIKDKISNALDNNIQPIICVDNTNDLNKEISFILNGEKQFNPIFAYEPSWAIDSNKVASVEKINLVASQIKSTCKNLGFDSIVLYGGGVDLNTYQQIKTAKVDGFLLGGICLNIKETISLIKEVDNE